MDFFQVIHEMVNLSTNDIPELLALDTWDVIDVPVVNTARTLEDIGKEQNSSSKKSEVTHITLSISSRRTPCFS